MEDIKISQHAIDRFVERSLKLGMKGHEDPGGLIRNLLRQAKPEKMDPVYKVKRIINNRCQDAEYYVCQGWRFVVSTNGRELVTVERVKKDQN